MEDWQAQEVERIFPDVKAARLTKEVEDLAEAYTHATHMEDDLKEKLAEAEAVCCSLDISQKTEFEEGKKEAEAIADA